MTVLETTMNEMPLVFTSNEFNTRAIKNGYPQRLVKGKGLCFIKEYASNEGIRSKTWTKFDKTNKTKTELLFGAPIKDVEQLAEERIQGMIKELKEKGYKIMKPVSEWLEL